MKRFIQLDPTVFDLFRVDEGTRIIQRLTWSNAFYHKGCYNNFNDSHYERLFKRVQKHSSEGSPYSTKTISHQQKKTEIGKAVCLFCDIEDYKDKLTAAGEYHSGSNNPNTKHVESSRKKWKEMAMQLGELDVNAKLCCGDVQTSQIITKQHVICGLEIQISTETRKECIYGTQNSSFRVLCMEADIQYDIWLLRTFYWRQ